MTRQLLGAGPTYFCGLTALDYGEYIPGMECGR